jgi:ATP synthase F1 delta subunit
MRTSLLADRYAEALREAIAEPAQLEKAAQALNAISAAYTEELSLRNVLGNSALDIAGRKQVLDTVMQAIGTPDTVARLLHTLIDHNRMVLLPTIALRFESHIDEWLNRVEVTVATAVPLTPALETKLTESLSKFSGKTVRMKNKVDPNIVGGLIVYMWGVFFDFSLRTRLGRLKQKLLSEETLTYGN